MAELKPILRVLGWAAVSSADQAEDDKYSIPSQVEAIAAFCEKQRDKYDVVLVDTILIDGHSRKFGTLAKLIANVKDERIREQLQRFAQHLDAADFDVLVCRDANRFARKSSLLHEIADLVIEDCGARIYSFGDGWGWVDDTNVDAWLTIKGYETRQQSRWISRAMQSAKIALLEKGLPHNSNLCWSHRRVRDVKTGKSIRIVPDPAKQHIVIKAAQVFVYGVSRFARKVVSTRPAARPLHSPLRYRRPPMKRVSVGYHSLERTLWRRYRLGRDGKPLTRLFFHYLFWNPTFHGNKAMNYKMSNKAGGQDIGPWVYDPSYPLREGVIIRYGIVEPALPPDLLRLVQAELNRRFDMGQRYRTENTHIFTGVILCGKCGHHFVFDNNKGQKPRWYCQSKHHARAEPRCTTKHGIREELVIQWLTPHIKKAIENNWPALFMDEQPQPNLNQVAQLVAEIQRVQTEADNLVTALRKSPPELTDTFHRQLGSLASELTSLKKALARAEREAAESTRADSRADLDKLAAYEDIADFWREDPNHINQVLRRLMGKRRILVADRRVLGTRLAP